MAVDAVSLVIPIRNEVEETRELVEAIRAQRRPPDEVILVDGGSTDGTLDQLRDLVGDDPTFVLVEAGPATPGRGRNVGIERASHPWVALTDAGVFLQPDWLAELLAAAEREPDAEVVFGNYEPLTPTFFTRCAALAYVPPPAQRPPGLTRGPSTASMLITRAAWAEVGGFPDRRAAEDLEFFDALARRGVTQAWAPAALVRWKLQPSLQRTFSRFVTYSRHNALAGRQWDWHYGILRQYGVAVPFLILAGWSSPLWLLVPGAGFLGRTLRSIWRRREGRGLGWALNPAQIAVVGTLLLAIDAATFIGWIQSVAIRPSGLQRAG